MKDLTLKQFEAFYWIARLGSFHAAARHLKMRQPSVSARVHELERHLGVLLFDRSGRSARLTPKGRELLTYADQMLRLTGEVEQRIGSRAALVGRVRFGVTSIPAVTWMPRMIRRLARAFPGIEPEFVVDTSENMRRQLLEGDLDLAFLAGPLAEPSLVTEELGRAAMAWLASPELPLPGPMLAPRDLVEIAVISDARGSFLHGLALAWFHGAGVEPQRHHACASLPTRIELARQGLGVAIAPPAVAAREIADGHLRMLAAEPALPPLPYVIAIAGGQVSPAVSALLQLAREAIAEEPEFHITVVPPS
jgi:DNA-binding transcriptional LysR family regulator